MSATTSTPSTFTPSTTSTSLSPSQRLVRFVDEELGSFAFATTAYTGVVLAKEFLTADAAHASGRPRLQQALRKTGALLPAIVLSTAVGIAGMKLSIAAVSHAREDYTRSSVLLAFPVTGALLYMQRGPRAMAMAALGFSALGYGADHLLTQWHGRDAQVAANVGGSEAARLKLHHQHQYGVFHAEPFRPSAFLYESAQE